MTATTARALFIDGAAQAEVRTVEVPDPGPDQLRVRVHHVGICGSDLHYFDHGANGDFAVREPLIPGHELSGTVDLDPTGTLAPGTPVTVHPARFGAEDSRFPDAPQLWPGGSYLGSASTWPHTQGALSELLTVDRRMIRQLPPSLPIRRAVLAEPLAVALHAVEQARRAGARLDGARVLVSGGGPVGLLVIAALRAAGCTDITGSDVLPGPRTRMREHGAGHTVDARREDLPNSAYDLVMECSGAVAAISSALTAVRPAGVVTQVGMLPGGTHPIALSPFIAKEVRLVGTFRFSDEIDAAVELLARRPEIGSVITHELPPDEPEALFATARDAENSGKVITAPWEPCSR